MSESNRVHIGVIAPKNTPDEMRWLMTEAGLHTQSEPYCRGRSYDVVFFFNLTAEVEWIKKHTDSKVFAIAIDSDAVHEPNCYPRYVDLCDHYMGYKNFSTPSFRGEYERFVYPAATTEEINQSFKKNLSSKRDYTFSIFAKHDPNIRRAIGNAIKDKNGLLLGQLFGNPVGKKMEHQVKAKFEFITENVVNDYYLSEKLPQALLAGCVPVYYGCRRVKELVPSDLFIDFTDFPGVHEVVEYCSDESVYDQYFSAIRARGRQYLLEHSTFDANIFRPLNAYLDRLRAEGYRSTRQGLSWRMARMKLALRKFVQHGL